jgi:hypothetical protein
MLLGGVYVYFSNDLMAQAATSSTSSISSSQSESDNLLGSVTDNQIQEDTAFLATLISLTKIKIDTSLFGNSSFNSLNDNTVLLEPSVTGRANPFAPISGNAPQAAQVSLVTTNIPTGVTDKTAVLNGAVGSDVDGVTSTYFEYGPTPTFGKSTIPAKQSLIGTFVTSVSGLSSKTTYFFHAVAKVGATLHYGETLSFTTN